MTRDEEEDAAPPPPGYTTPTKRNSNHGAAHAESNAEVTNAESYADLEKQFDESTGKKRKYHPYLNYTEVKRLTTGEDAKLEPAQMNHEIYTLMKKFMRQELPTDI